MKISLADVKKLISEPYLSRGKAYCQEGAVRLVALDENTAKARVMGSYIYTVTLSFKNNILKLKCTCPAFDDFGPCKHAAATCFLILAAPSWMRIEEPTNKKKSTKNDLESDDYDEMEEYEELERRIRALKKEELIDLIMKIDARHPGLIEECCF